MISLTGHSRTREMNQAKKLPGDGEGGPQRGRIGVSHGGAYVGIHICKIC